MPIIVRAWTERKNRILVPGGWEAQIPQVQAESSVRIAYRDYFMSEGMGASKAEMRALEVTQNQYTACYLDGLKRQITYWAKRYSQKWPKLVEEVTYRYKPALKPLGFKPQEVQFWFVPGQRPGPNGLDFAERELQRMGEQHDK